MSSAVPAAVHDPSSSPRPRILARSIAPSGAAFRPRIIFIAVDTQTQPSLGSPSTSVAISASLSFHLHHPPCSSLNLPVFIPLFLSSALLSSRKGTSPTVRTFVQPKRKPHLF
ncbi:unnamed protein product [Mortierella alpina]